jgi:hypothetical protein
MILLCRHRFVEDSENCAGHQAVARLNVVVSPFQSVDRLQRAAVS